jgi:2-oxoglutarate ferredoxin oxidoreductase subunit alpha
MKTTLMRYGSTYGMLKEAVDVLRDKGWDINLLHLSEIWPFPAEIISALLDGAKQSFVVEDNAIGQLVHPIRPQTGRRATGNILRFDGCPFAPALIEVLLGI